MKTQENNEADQSFLVSGVNSPAYSYEENISSDCQEENVYSKRTLKVEEVIKSLLEDIRPNDT